MASTRSSATLGAVAELWRYPVKSMQGEPLREACIGNRGIPGDRAYALVEGILLTIADHSRVMIAPLRNEMPSVGVYALVEQPGALRLGDELRAGTTTLLRKSVFWWTLARNLARRRLPARE